MTDWAKLRHRILPFPGDTPLDLADVYFLGMDWKNADKCEPYVMVESRDLEYLEDDSMSTAPQESRFSLGGNSFVGWFTCTPLGKLRRVNAHALNRNKRKRRGLKYLR